jgi:hypothetical protein
VVIEALVVLVALPLAVLTWLVLPEHPALAAVFTGTAATAVVVAIATKRDFPGSEMWAYRRCPWLLTEQTWELCRAAERAELIRLRAEQARELEETAG